LPSERVEHAERLKRNVSSWQKGEHLPQIGARSQVEGLLPPAREDLVEEAISFSDFRARIFEQLRLLLHERAFLGRAFLAGLVAGCLLAFLIPARYESSAQLMPPDNQAGSGLALLAAMSNRASGGNGGGGGAMGAVAGDLLGLKSSGALFIGILNSRTVEDRLIDRFQLKKAYSLSLDEEARKKLAANTAISEDRKSGIISIAVTDRDPRRAAALTQGYVEELNQLSAELSTSAAHRERVFLEQRLHAVKQDLDDASEKFSQFSSKNTTIDIKEQAKAMVEGASVLQGQLIAAESELKGLEQIYTPSNVRVKAVAARIAELQKQLEKLSGKGYGDPQTATADENHDLYPSIRQLPLLGVTYADLYRRTKIQEIVYETLTQQYELAKVQEAKELPSIKVLDAAKVPERKSFPPRLLIILGVAMVFGAAAALMVIARSKWENTDESDPGKLFAQEVLVTVSARAQHQPGNGFNGHARSTIWSRMKERRAKLPNSDF
jgi:uncharacterized protein involved in exopolysaccharide biosynthesis